MTALRDDQGTQHSTRFASNSDVGTIHILNPQSTRRMVSSCKSKVHRVSTSFFFYVNPAFACRRREGNALMLRHKTFFAWMLILRRSEVAMAWKCTLSTIFRCDPDDPKNFRSIDGNLRECKSSSLCCAGKGEP